MLNVQLTESFKVYYPHYKTGLRYKFTLQCPNLDHQLTLSLLHDATVRGDIHYYDVCKVADSVTIAFHNTRGVFEVYLSIQSMVWYPPDPQRGRSYIPWNWELIAPFLTHNNLKSTWIVTDRKDFGFVEETGTFRGIKGKVKRCYYQTKSSKLRSSSDRAQICTYAV